MVKSIDMRKDAAILQEQISDLGAGDFDEPEDADWIRAPERIASLPYDLSVDVYALGKLIENLMKRWGVKSEVFEFQVQTMISEDPSLRPSVRQLLQLSEFIRYAKISDELFRKKVSLLQQQESQVSIELPEDLACSKQTSDSEIQISDFASLELDTHNKESAIKTSKSWRMVECDFDINQKIQDKRKAAELSKHCTALRAALMVGNVEAVRQLSLVPEEMASLDDLESRHVVALLKPCCCSEKSHSLLMAVTADCPFCCIKYLDQAGKKMDDSYGGKTALIRAVEWNKLDCLLVIASAEARIQDVRGCTAMMHAVKLGQIDMVRHLSRLEAGLENRRHETALGLAITLEYRAIAAMLWKNKAERAVLRVRYRKMARELFNIM